MIGVIDSGSGGLGVLKALIETLPPTEYLYFGDIKNAPYGEKTPAELSRLTIESLKFLKQHDVQQVVSACNSVSASMAISLFDTLLSSQQIIEMVGPTVAHFPPSNQRIAICATPATITSQMYQNGFYLFGHTDVVAIPLPDLARQIEFGESEESIKDTITTAVEPRLGSFDTLILGCTHYPLVKKVFEEVVGEKVAVYDPAHTVAERAQKLFALDNATDKTSVRFVISQDSQPFRDYVVDFFSDIEHTIEVAP